MDIIDWFYTFILGIDYQNMVDKIPVNTALIAFCAISALLCGSILKFMLKEKFEHPVINFIVLLVVYLYISTYIANFIYKSILGNCIFAILFLVLLFILTTVILFKPKWKLVLVLSFCVLITFFIGNVFIPTKPVNNNSEVNDSQEYNNKMNDIDGFY